MATSGHNFSMSWDQGIDQSNTDIPTKVTKVSEGLSLIYFFNICVELVLISWFVEKMPVLKITCTYCNRHFNTEHFTLALKWSAFIQQCVFIASITEEMYVILMWTENISVDIEFEFLNTITFNEVLLLYTNIDQTLVNSLH